ncbi:MAG: hypothetical protein HQK72_01455 [Desulfamplus sp.]|nr:hypothetical protein [Desulfamplus sp.]
MKYINIAITIFSLLLLPSLTKAATGVWQTNDGEYIVVLSDSISTSYAFKIAAQMDSLSFWSFNNIEDSKVVFDQIWPSTGTITANLGSSDSLTGTYIVSGVSSPFAAVKLFDYMGSGMDGIYSSSVTNRYMFVSTLAVNNAPLPLVIDLDIDTGKFDIFGAGFAEASATKTQLGGASLLNNQNGITFSESDTGNNISIKQGTSTILLEANPLFKPVFTETTQDYLGNFSKSPNFKELANKNIKVINLPEEESYFVYWQPEKLKQGRVMVLVHGTGGTPYAEIDDELEMGETYGYATLGIRWLSTKTLNYFSAAQVYRIISKGLQHLKDKYGNDLERIAYVGFSRGSAVSYETTYIDLMSKHYFDLTISHSGGIPTEVPMNPKQDTPDVFFANLIYNRLGNEAMSGTKFFLYCGEKDEEWGTQMCEQIEYAKAQIESHGGTVVEIIHDVNGFHAGYRNILEYHKRGVEHFIELTK